MLKRIVKLIRHNLGYKILAVVLAVILWLVIVNIDDPEKTAVYTVEVTIEHPNYLKNHNQLYTVQSGTDQLSFTVTGSRSVIDKLSEDDFEVTADLQDIDDQGRVYIQLSVLKYSSRVEVSKQSDYLVLDVTDMASGVYDVSLEVEGEVADGYQLLGTSLDTETITVRGSEEDLEKISSVYVTLDAEGLTEDTQVEKKVRLLNKRGRVMDTSDMNLSAEEILVTADVGVTKTVPLKVRTSGSPLSGYSLVKTTLSETEVTIAGEEEILASVDQIILKGNSLRLKEKSASYTVEMDIADYLPEGVVLADGAPETVEVTIGIEKDSDSD